VRHFLDLAAIDKTDWISEKIGMAMYHWDQARFVFDTVKSHRAAVVEKT
jgi:hypothetical protein